MTKEELLKLQNGSDIRGIALSGVEGEEINLTEEACLKIGGAFAVWLSKKTGKPCQNLTVGIGRDSRLSGPKLEIAIKSTSFKRNKSRSLRNGNNTCNVYVNCFSADKVRRFNNDYGKPSSIQPKRNKIF